MYYHCIKSFGMSPAHWSALSVRSILSTSYWWEDVHVGSCVHENVEYVSHTTVNFGVHMVNTETEASAGRCREARISLFQ